MIKYSRTKVIAFDIDEALSFKGESGPYLQYAVVRANNIFQKLQERDGLSEARRLADELPDCRTRRRSTAPTATTSSGIWCSKPPGWTKSSSRSCARSSLRCWRSTAFGLAQMFNAFYHRSSDRQRRARGRPPLARGRGGATSASSSPGCWT